MVTQYDVYQASDRKSIETIQTNQVKWSASVSGFGSSSISDTEARHPKLKIMENTYVSYLFSSGLEKKCFSVSLPF